MSRRQLLGYAGAATAAAWLAGCSDPDERPGPQARLTHRIVGDPRPDGFTVSTRTVDASGVRVKVATDEDLSTDVVYSEPSRPDEAGWTKHVVQGLEPGRGYHYGIEVTDSAGPRLVGDTGRARTLPPAGEAASFAFAFGSCMASGVKDPAVMRRILERDPLLFLHLGDFGYFDNPSTEVESHRSDFETQISSNSGLEEVLATIPTVYIQSDHDAGGGNNEGPGPWTAPNRAAYRQVFPHPDVAGHEDGLYWSLVVGRVRLIFTDHKTYCSPVEQADSADKTMLGVRQKEWFISELREPEPVKIWVQHGPFIDGDGEGDMWGNYATEQREVADFLSGEAVGEVLTVHGDMHAVAVSTRNPWNLRSWCAAPFHNESSHKGGPWTSGPHPKKEDAKNTRQYGFVEVTDDGRRIRLQFAGCDHRDEVHVSDALTVGPPV